MTSTVITPTVGRKVWFRQNGIKALQEAGVLEYLPTPLIVNGGDQPLDATVVYVWNDRCVNLTILDHSGHPFIATSVPLLQDGDEKPASGFYCEWMPYQKGQAAKAEAAQASEPSGCPITPMRDQLEYLLVSGAAARLAEAPNEAASIAAGIKSVLDALRPQSMLLNPHTGAARDPRDVASDPQAILCVEPGEPLKAATVTLPVVDPGPDSLERAMVSKTYQDGTTAFGPAPLPDVSPAVWAKPLGKDAPELTVSLSDLGLEREIQAKAGTRWEHGQAPRVTMDEVNAQIVGETYTVLPSGRVTVCELTLKNGFTVRGESAVVFIENNVPQTGREIARKNAVDQIWPLLGFRLRDELARPVLTEADAAADLADVKLVPTHQQRVIDEKRELDERLSKLDAFILDNPLYLQLSTAEQDRLSRQSKAMAAYSGILDERIAKF